MQMMHTQRARPNGRANSDDWFVAAVGRVQASGDLVCEEILQAVGALDAGRRARLDGASISTIVDSLIGVGGRDARLAAHEAFLEFERSIQMMRAGVVRALVDDEGFSLTAAARRLRVSRQAAARLYTAAAEFADLRPLNDVT
jgi:hypothetical protein